MVTRKIFNLSLSFLIPYLVIAFPQVAHAQISTLQRMVYENLSERCSEFGSRTRLQGINLDLAELECSSIYNEGLAALRERNVAPTFSSSDLQNIRSQDAAARSIVNSLFRDETYANFVRSSTFRLVGGEAFADLLENIVSSTAETYMYIDIEAPYFENGEIYYLTDY